MTYVSTGPVGPAEPRHFATSEDLPCGESELKACQFTPQPNTMFMLPLCLSAFQIQEMQSIPVI